MRWLATGDLLFYSADYRPGGLHLLGLRTEFVDSGEMTERNFQGSIWQANLMPIYLVRAFLTG